MIALLLLAVHPAMLNLTAAPGALVDVPLTIQGEGKYSIVGGGSLSGSEDRTITGVSRQEAQLRVRPDTPPGLGTGYVYIIPKGGDMAAGVGVRVNLNITPATGTSSIVPGTAHLLLSTPPAALAGGGALLVAGALFGTGAIRISKGNGKRSPRAGGRTPPPTIP